MDDKTTMQSEAMDSAEWAEEVSVMSEDEMEDEMDTGITEQNFAEDKQAEYDESEGIIYGEADELRAASFDANGFSQQGEMAFNNSKSVFSHSYNNCKSRKMNYCCNPCRKPNICVKKLVNSGCVKFNQEITFRVIVKNFGCHCEKIVVCDKLDTNLQEVRNSVCLNGQRIYGSMCRGIAITIYPCEVLCFEFKAKLKYGCKVYCVKNVAMVRLELACYCSHCYTSNAVFVKIFRPKPKPKPCCCCCCCCFCGHNRHHGNCGKNSNIY